MIEVIKRCGNCSRFLGENDFYWVNKKKLKKASSCKKCVSTKTLIWQLLNPEKTNIKALRGYYKNPTLYSKWIRKHPEYNRMNALEWAKANPHKANAKTRRYQAKKLDLTPLLSTEEKHIIEILYKWSDELPGNWHVDHIIPLSKGGLHHPNNLQVIPSNQNHMKGNILPKEFYGKFYKFCIGSRLL